MIDSEVGSLPPAITMVPLTVRVSQNPCAIGHEKLLTKAPWQLMGG